MTTGARLEVQLQGQKVGELCQGAGGKMQFTYVPGATQAVSIGMPITTRPYDHRRCEAFFGGLLPESDAVRLAIARQYGVSANNSFALLKAIGYDCAGAVSLCVPGDGSVPAAMPLSAKVIADEALYQHIKNLPKKPLFMGLEGLRLSLAGVHDKAAVCLLEGQIALPILGCPTTHILKPSLVDFPNIVENEYLCLRLAQAVGLPVPSVQIRQLNELTFLLIERYDRVVRHDRVTRLHQEDFCQALGVVSAQKYQAEGGPGLRESFELLAETALPAIARNQFMQAVLFNFLIGNHDAHAKNFSLLYQANGSVMLAPLYDLVSTQIYAELTDKMAMKIASKYQADKIRLSHWQRLCEEVHYAYPQLKRQLFGLGEALLTQLNSRKFREGLGNVSSAQWPVLCELLAAHINARLQSVQLV